MTIKTRLAHDVTSSHQWPLNSRFGSCRARTQALAGYTSTGTLSPA